jgi:hypothetical protein
LVGTPAESFCHAFVDYLFLEDYISLAVDAWRTFSLLTQGSGDV